MRAEDEICPKCGKNIYRPEDDTVYETPEGEEPSPAEAPSLPEESVPGDETDEK